jgi:hypothetical protein
MRERRFEAVLALQLLLAFFAPPLAWGDRLLFPADVFAAFWLAAFLVRDFITSAPAGRRRVLGVVALVGGSLGLVYVHGAQRPSLAAEFSRFIVVENDDLFSPIREAVIAIRFAVWFLCGYVVSRRALDRGFLLRVLALASLAASLSIVVTAFSPGVRAAFGVWYRYDPTSPDWAYRSFGVFRSPVAATAALSLAFLLLMEGARERKIPRGIFGILAISIALTQTLTSFLAAGIALGLSVYRRLEGRLRIAGAAGALAVTAIAATLVWDTRFGVSKRGNLVFRTGMWRVYWESALSRWDRLLLGNGFHPHFSDNLYVFLFSRGGLFLLGLAAWLFIRWWKREGRTLGPIPGAIPIFFLVAGLSIDSLILRPVVSVLVCVGIPLLSRPRAGRA